MSAKLKLIIIFNLVIMTQTDHSVTKRSLLFPRATVLQFTYGISAPAILPRRSINLSLCLQVNYDLPYNLTRLFQTRVVAAKSQSGGFDFSRETFYEYIMEFLDTFGLSGEQCLYRLVCEMSEFPMHLGHRENLLEKIAHFVFTPSLEFSGNSTGNFRSELLEAEDLGRRDGNCHKMYSKCFISLASLFTAKYIV